MRPVKGKVSKSILKKSNMAPKKGITKENTGVSAVKKKKAIAKNVTKADSKKKSKVLQSKPPKSLQMGIAKSIPQISSKISKIAKQSLETVISSPKEKVPNTVETSITTQDNKKDKIDDVKSLSSDSKKNKKDSESKLKATSSPSSKIKDSPKSKIAISTKPATKKVVHKQSPAKKNVPTSKAKNTEKSKAKSKSEESKSCKKDKPEAAVESSDTSGIAKEKQKAGNPKKSDDNMDVTSKSRTNSPEKKPAVPKSTDTSPSTDKKLTPKTSNVKPNVNNDFAKKNKSKATKVSPKKLINKIKESTEVCSVLSADNKSESSSTNVKTINLDPMKDVKNIALPSFASNQSVSPSGRKKLVGKVKPIARVKGTIIEKLITDPVIQQNVIIPSTHLNVSDESKSVNTALKSMEDVKKTSPDKDHSNVPKVCGESRVTPSLTEKISNVQTSQQDASRDEPPKKKPVTVAKAKKVIAIKNITKGKKLAVEKGMVVKRTPKSSMLKNVKLAKRLLKVSECAAVDDSASESISSSDDITYSFPDTPQEPPEETLNSDNKISQSESAIKPKVTKALPKKILVKNKKCQGMNRGISQAHSKEKKTKCSITEKESTKIDKDIVKEDVVCVTEIAPKKVESNSSQQSASASNTEKVENKIEESKKSNDPPMTKDKSVSNETLNISNDSLSDSKNDADDEEERYSFPQIKKELKASSSSNKKKKTNESSSSKSPKKIAAIPVADDVLRRKKLLGFWSGPKKYREASLNAQAKVQCLYENESRSHVELGLMRTIDRFPPKFKDKESKKPVIKTEIRDSTSSSSESEYEKKIKVESASEDDSDPPVKRNLRQHPTGAGKYWEMKLSSSEESEAEHKKQSVEKKKTVKTKVVVKSEKEKEKPSELNPENIKTEKPVMPKPKKPQTLKKKRNRTEVVMDLRDMVVRKRMASLNATAILAASYEKRSPKSKDESTSDSASSEREERKSKKPKSQTSNEKTDLANAVKRETSDKNASSELKMKTLIVNQEADVTITGVYSTHTAHTGFCTVSEMQYRISATSHTQTSAAASVEKEVPNAPGASPASYTPLGALSSMHPPGGVSGMPQQQQQQHLHPGPSIESRGPLVGSLGRRAGCSSAFSAPPHHHSDADRSGYYQPAGPLISPGPLHGGFKTDSGSSAGSAQPPQDTGYGRYPYPQPQQVMHYNPHYGAGPGPGYGSSGPPAPPPRLPVMPPPPAASCYRPPPPAHRSHHPHPPYRPPPPTDNQVSPAGTDAYAPQFCPPCYQHPHAPPRQAISYLESAYQGCPCPMQSCPKNVHTGPATGNPPASSGPSQSSTSGGKRISQETSGGGCCAVALNPSLGLVPPETLGPPSPARGSAGLDPPHPPRRARLGKAMARKSIAPEEPPGHTTLLMCHPVPPPPLTINTDPLPPKVETVKSEEDSGDDVIIIDSPNSKLAPIDLSSSDENNCNDSKSEKDCEIVRKEEKDPVVGLISTETKKDSVDDIVKTSEQPISTSESQTKVDTKTQETPTSAKNKSTSEPVKKCSDVKSKSGTKRRCSNLDIDMEIEIDDSLAANGIGEHVKLQKRQKVLQNDTLQPKKNGAMTGKGFMKKNNRLLTLTTSNVKKHLNNTTKVDKYKQTNKLPVAAESDKGSSKKIGAKRKSSTPLEEVPTNKRKKLSQSLLKSADKKQASKSPQDDTTIEDKTQKEKILPVPKAKSVALLDNLLMKNNLDRVIDCVARNIPSDSSEPVSVLNPAALFSVTTATSSPRASRKVSMLKPKKCPQISEDLAGVNSGKTVLNINNNVVKKAIELDCEIVPMQKTEDKITTDKHSRTKSKSPAAINRLTERKSIDIAAKIKNQSEPDNIVKDIPLAITKIEGIVKGKKTKGKRKSKSIDNTEFEEADLALLNRPIGQPRWSNGWVWEGESQLSRVYINNEDTIKARCWSAMRHSQAGDTVKRGDSVLLRAGARRSEAPFVAKVSQLWENPPDGEMMVSLLWYYRPEHTERGRQPDDCTDEVFASKHRDANSVACIEDKCYVLTYNEYCRYRKQLRASEENIRCPPSIVPSMPKNDLTPSITTNDAKIPLNISPDLVLFCRRIYDFRLKKVLKPQQSLQHLRYNV